MALLLSHAGHALRGTAGVFTIGMPPRYYLDQLKLLVLLCPAVAMLLPFAVWRHRPADEVTAFTRHSGRADTAVQTIWKAQPASSTTGISYAIGAMLTALLIWRYAAMAAVAPSMRIAAAALAAIGCLHTYAWIVANHQLGR